MSWDAPQMRTLAIEECFETPHFTVCSSVHDNDDMLYHYLVFSKDITIIMSSSSQ
jgi:hypothetical protein